MINVRIPPAELQPMIEQIARTVVAELNASNRRLLNNKLALNEPEAAALLDLNSWQLRDLRKDGKINFHRIVGGRIRYSVADIDEYLAGTHQRGT